MPRGWIYIAEFGIRQMAPDPRSVVASVGLGQDMLGEEDTLVEYIDKQKELIVAQLKGAAIAGPQPVPFSGSEEAQLVFVRHSVESVGNILHAQTYVRHGKWLGIVTLTTLEAEVRAVRPDYDAFVKGLYISPSAATEPVGTV